MNKKKPHMQLWWLILGAMAAGLILGACGSTVPVVPMDEDAPDFIDPLPSPTPTWVAPDPDDEDPIADCTLDAPLCVIDVALVELGGEAYLGVDLQGNPAADDAPPEGAGGVLMDVSIAVQRDGTTVAEIDLQGSTVAVAPAGGSLKIGRAHV